MHGGKTMGAAIVRYATGLYRNNFLIFLSRRLIGLLRYLSDFVSNQNSYKMFKQIRLQSADRPLSNDIQINGQIFVFKTNTRPRRLGENTSKKSQNIRYFSN